MFFVIRWKDQSGTDFVEVFTVKKQATEYMKENFNAYGKQGASLEEFPANELHLVVQGNNAQFH